jgi:hypothetical protein
MIKIIIYFLVIHAAKFWTEHSNPVRPLRFESELLLQ